MDRLTKLIKPKKIFMGKKDFQQLFLVKNFIENKFNTKVIGCKTIGNSNKLALSSRNFLLKENELNDVEKISKNFLNLKKKIKHTKNINQFLQKKKKNFKNFFNIKIEYLKNETKPITSVIVVTNTLEAIAGSIFIFFKVTGTKIPKSPAMIIVRTIEIEIIIERVLS